ncbi:hypothetical protein AAFF_G00412140 [Aldrovandia affinis]|uniref:MAX gene-associated protein n=1 Tax=Aldrovandia affinis TaxID=143900 RepID=A0AAD7SBW9_9TELE|nr:hypothetical protein AAFF_G00412140 [Aldrovandia affinis]
MVLHEEGAAAPAPASATPPAFFVILKPGQASEGGLDQGILVANQEANLATTSTPALRGLHPAAPCVPSVTCAAKSNTQPDNLPPESTCKGIKVTLDNNNMWNEFYRCKTEMILTKQGRRMFPYCRFRISGMEPFQRYILVMDITPVDNYRYRWTGQQWEVNGKAEPHVLGRVFIHTESPSSGHYWMQNPISFYKLKLTNNTLDQEGHVILHSKHRYLPRLHVVPADKATEVIQLNGPDVLTFTFPQTEFIAVTAYQNLRITQLKIDYNPFAKGFREDGPGHQPLRSRPEPPNASMESPRFVGDNEDVSPLKKSLKSLLLNTAFDTFVMDQELFSSADYNIGFLDNGISAKSSEKDVSIKKRPAYGAPSEAAPEPKLRIRRAASQKVHIDSITLKEEEVELVLDRVISQQSQPDGPTDVNVAKVKTPAGGEPGVDVKPHSDLTPGASQQPSGPAVPAGTGGREPPTPPGDSEPLHKQGAQTAKRAEPVPLPLLALFLKQRRLKPRVIAPKPTPAAPESPSSGPAPPSPEPEQSSCAPTSPSPTHQPPSRGPKLPSPDPAPPSPAPAQSSSSPAPAQRSSSPDGPDTSGSLDGSDPPVNSAAAAAAAASPSASEPPGTAQSAAQPSSGKRKRKPRPRSRKHGKHGRRSDVDPGVIGGPTDVGMQPNLEDVEGLLFVSFTSKEALEFHLGDEPLNKELPASPQKAVPASPEHRVEETLEEKIARLQISLLQDLKRLKHRQVIHPVLQEVGLKLNLLDPTLPIDLRYLGVCLPLPPPFLSPGDEGTSGGWISDGAVPFVSRTGKTTDFTKIKGWRDKFNIASDVFKAESSAGLDGVLKHRSAFCSDMLDEYLENEGKLIDERAASFAQSAVSPVVYQLPTKSTSYVRTLDSVLKKQIPAPSFPRAPFKPLSPPKKPRPKAPARPKPPKPTPTPAAVLTTSASPSPAPAASHSARPAAKTKTAPKALRPPGSVGEAAAGAPEDLPVKQEPGQATQGLSGRTGVSKLLLKLMDLEDGAVWEGKARTCITVERAEIALTSLLTAQGTLKASPAVPRVFKRRAPPCLNAFCRLGCLCTSLALERRQPTHCGKTECMFGCTCLKRKVVLVKTPPKKKKEEGLIFYGALGEDSPPKKKKKKKRMMAYTISEPEPQSEPATRVRTLWNQKDEIDPEPLHIPEPIHFPSAAVPVTCQDPSAFSHRAPRPKLEREDDKKDPVYLYFESKMTCARVRPYRSKAPPPQAVCSCRSLLCSGKEDDPYHNFPDSTPGKAGVLHTEAAAGKTSKESTPSSPKTQPSKRLEIVSECKWVKKSDRNHVLRVVCEHMAQNRLSQPFRIGPYHVRPLSQTLRLEDQGHSLTYKVCISQPPSLPRPAEGEAVAEEEEEPEEDAGSEDSNEDFAGGADVPKRTALPFLIGVCPAGILTASRKQAGVPAQGLIKVNGKSYPQAKLQLGQMGALHPANRLAAYITGRLRPAGQEASATSSAISKRPSSAGPKDTVSTPQAPHPKVTSVATVTSGPTPVLHPLDGSTPPKTKVSPLVAGAPSGPRMLLIPVSPPAPGARSPAPVSRGASLIAPSFAPLTPGQRMVLQPVRHSSGNTLYRHPDGHLIQLVPLSQLRPIQPNLLIRNPGSVVRLPTPVTVAPVSGTASATKTPSAAPGTSVPAGPRVTSPTTVQNNPPAATPKLGSLSGASAFTLSSLPPSLKTLPGFLGQTGTYTLRISPSTSSKEPKVSKMNPAGPPPASPEVLSVPGSFTLLQLPKSATAAKPAARGALAPSGTPPKRDPAAEPSSRSRGGDALQGSGDPEEPLEVTPAGVVCADHSYTSGLSSLDGSQETDHSYTAGSTQGQDNQTGPPAQAELQPITIPSSAELRPITAPSSAQPGNPTDAKVEASLLSSSSKTSHRDAGAAPPLVTGARTVSRDELDSGLPSEAEASTTPLTGHVATVTALVGAPCRPPEEKQPLEEGEVEAEVEVDMGGDVGSEDLTEDSDEDSDDNSEDDNVKVVSGKAEQGSEDEPSDVTDDVMERDWLDCSSETEESEGSEEGEAVDIETVEELTEKINIARMKAVAMQKKLSGVPIMQEAKRTAEHKARQQQEGEEEEQEGEEKEEPEVGKEGVAVTNVVVRIQHNVMERRRRSELRDLFQQLQEVLSLQHLPKVSKAYILKQATNEIQALVDQCDRLEEKKKMLSRQRAAYIKKISQTSGKTEDMIIQKLQDISARQKTLEAQRKRKGSKHPAPSPCRSLQPNILARRKPPGPTATSTALPGTLVAGGPLVSGLAAAVPNQQVLTIKGPLQPFTVLRPGKSSEGPAIPGVASVTINVPGMAFPIAVKSPVPEHPPSGSSQVLASPVTANPIARKTVTLPMIVSAKSLAPLKADKGEGGASAEDGAALPPAPAQSSGPRPAGDYGRASLEDGEVLEDQLTCDKQDGPAPASACSPDNGPEEERLMSLLSEIAFLNQQTNSEDSGLLEVTQGRKRWKGAGEKEAEQVGGVEGDDDRSLSPLFLQLDEDVLGTKDSQIEQLGAPAGEEQPARVVVGQEQQPKRGAATAMANGFGRQSPPCSVKGGALTPPPLLQMKAGSAAMVTDSKVRGGERAGGEVSWRPMPRLAPLGLKAGGPAQDSTVSTKAPPEPVKQNATQTTAS